MECSLYGIWNAPFTGYGMLPVKGYDAPGLRDMLCSLYGICYVPFTGYVMLPLRDMVCSLYGIWNLIKCLLEKSALVECFSRWMILIFQRNKVLDM
nr:hypothetical protein Iba_chr07aCG6450 [Ipomoea batatas]